MNRRGEKWREGCKQMAGGQKESYPAETVRDISIGAGIKQSEEAVDDIVKKKQGA